MRGSLHLRVLCVLGLTLVFSACAVSLSAQQPVAADTTPRNEIQTEPDAFLECTKLLTEASTKEARRDAFKAVLARAREVKQDPRPLVDVLKNKQPQATFVELLSYLKDNAGERHSAFLPTLIVAAHDTGESAANAKELVLAYKASDAVTALIGLLKGADGRGAVAAATLCREHIGGLSGMARVVEPLVGALESTDTELRAAAHRSLRSITRLTFDQDARAWREWLKGKDDEALMEEIGNNWIKAKKERDKEFETLQQELLKVLIERMRKDDRKDAARLMEHLARSPYTPVREEAAKLLGEMLAAYKETEQEQARAAVTALGDPLLQAESPESLRIACARALAAKPALSFDVIARCLDQNGNSPALKLELVRALKTPAATGRLAQLLREEIDRVETSSSKLLLELIAQSRNIVATTSEEAALGSVLAQYSRLLETIEGKLAQELAAPELARFDELARETCSVLAYFARILRVDVSPCVKALMAIAGTRVNAASSALTAIREAVDMADSRAREVMRSQPMADRLLGLYTRLSGENNEPMLVLVIGLYEALGGAPEDVAAALRRRLLEFACASADTLGDTTRQTLRGAIRSLFARTVKDGASHTALIGELLDAPFGDNDVIAYLRLMPPPRVEVMVAAIQPRAAAGPVRMHDIVRKLTPADQKLPNLTKEEVEAAAFVALVKAVEDEVRTAFERRIESGLKGGEAETAEKLKADLTAFADKDLRLFIEAAYRQLLALPEPGANRDVVTALMLERLRTAHPGKYDQAKLEGAADAFKTALAGLSAQFKQDGYRV